MAEADAEHRHTGLDDAADGADGVVAGLRITWPVREEHALGRERERVLSRGLSGQHGDATAGIDQQPQDVVLNAVVEGDHMKRLLSGRRGWRIELGSLGPFVAHGGGRDLGEVHPLQARKGARASDRRSRVHLRPGDDAACLRALLAQDPRQAARVDARDGDHALSGEERRQRLLHAPVAGTRRQVAHHQPCGLRTERFHVEQIDADIADMRIGERDDLSQIGRIGEDLLIARQGGIEDNFPCGAALRADGGALEG